MKIITSVAGITFRNKDDKFTSLRPSGSVSLVSAPYVDEANPDRNDPMCIEVWYEGDHIGFIPKGTIGQEFAFNNADEVKAEIIGYGYATGTGKSLAFNDDHLGRLSAIQLRLSSSDSDDDGVVINEKNQYVVGTEVYERLTTVLSSFNPEPDNEGLDRWKCSFGSFDAYKKELNMLANNGTAMHKAIEDNITLKIKGELIPSGYWNFMKKFEVEIIGVEVMTFGSGIAGRCDLVAFVTDKGVRKRVAIDWKSSKKPTKKHAIQGGWYATHNECEEAWVVAFGGTNKQGYALKKVENVVACADIIYNTFDSRLLSAII